MELPACELCRLRASLRCPSDAASLCWRCDSLVHSANFLVARHCRALICSSCFSLTDCIVSGPSVQPKVPYCSHCFVGACRSGGFDRDDEESKIAASECVSGGPSGSSESSRKAPVKRPKIEAKKAASEECDRVISARSRCREQGEVRSSGFLKEIWTAETGESSCESNIVALCETAEDGNSSEEEVCAIESSGTSLPDGSLCGFLRHKRLRIDNSRAKASDGKLLQI